MGVLFGGSAVGGPAGVSNAEGAVDGAGGDDGFEVAELAGGAAELELGFAFRGVCVAGDGDASGVVAAVFEASQAFDDDGDGRFGTDIANNSAHE
jgi:hypothetical protein